MNNIRSNILNHIIFTLEKKPKKTLALKSGGEKDPSAVTGPVRLPSGDKYSSQLKI